jgi:hypothetical protein
MEPYAVYLLGRYRAGESVEQLVATEAVPRERIVMRLKVAAKYLQGTKTNALHRTPAVPSERAA